MKKGIFEVVIEKDSDGFFVADVPALRGCHTQAKDLNTLQKRVKEAIELCLMDEKEARLPNAFVGIQIVSV
ncbi:MAG: type II toxin-antitoxin system HicB family antitoxin [Candidatus Marsarchaeota archaeon]|jgi:predicted RNase H-like HicB family nuclease|nr:type II toxin-antitoxin system HicB family antitoxin [Candidatus Marsarchaeota archaeon]MCL5111795.1 type II toxin-antitoxin system HicB family antitoxin [Candidatus Marsarchaeota archaeon]